MSEGQRVYTSDGRQGLIVGETNEGRDDPRFVEVQMEDGSRLHVPAEMLVLRDDGAFDLMVGMAEIEGRTTAAPGADTGAGAGATRGSRRFVVPVVVEELEVGRRVATTGVVRVQKRVHEREQLVEETITREDVQIERTPVGRLVDAPPAMRNEGDTLIIPIVEEVLVVEKRLRLKEEVRVTWRRAVEPTAERVVLREEELVVERRPPDEGADAADKASL